MHALTISARRLNMTLSPIIIINNKRRLKRLTELTDSSSTNMTDKQLHHINSFNSANTKDATLQLANAVSKNTKLLRLELDVRGADTALLILASQIENDATMLIQKLNTCVSVNKA
jgi:hypothetical protein